MKNIENELTNNLTNIKLALTTASTSIEGVVAMDVLSLARAYNETVKTLLEVKKATGEIQDNKSKKNLLLEKKSDNVLSISFNDIINNQESKTLETPYIEEN